MKKRNNIVIFMLTFLMLLTSISCKNSERAIKLNGSISGNLNQDQEYHFSIGGSITLCGNNFDLISKKFYSRPGKFSVDAVVKGKELDELRTSCNSVDVSQVALKIHTKELIELDLEGPCPDDLINDGYDYIKSECGTMTSTVFIDNNQSLQSEIGESVIVISNINIDVETEDVDKYEQSMICAEEVIQNEVAPNSCNICKIEGGQCNKFSGALCFKDYECNSGLCEDNICLGKAGELCSSDNQCQSTVCKSGECLKHGGEFCNFDRECASDDCHAGICMKIGSQSCSFNSECISGECSFGKCQSLEGEKCKFNSDCVAGKCKFGVCE